MQQHAVFVARRGDYGCIVSNENSILQKFVEIHAALLLAQNIYNRRHGKMRQAER
jgi:hypothetical protein